MRLKSILAAVICISLLLTSQIFAADCPHNYESTSIAATCINKEQILYTCSLCGDSYSRPADEPVLPDSCYILMKSTRNDDKLIVTITLENNPGMYFMRMIFHYNEAALHPLSRINGEVWTDTECWTTTPPVNNPFFYTAQYDDMLSSNTKNGLVCTLEFEVLDNAADYGFKVTFDKKPFIDHNSNVLDVTVFNVVGKEKYGSHSCEERIVPPTCTTDGRTDRVCIYCGETLSTDILPATGHQWALTAETVSPTFEADGLALYTCENCFETKEEVLPALEHWKKGDLNNDNELSMGDLAYMHKVVSGTLNPSLQMNDAADLDCDGIVSMGDYATLSQIVAGKKPYPPGWE